MINDAQRAIRTVRSRAAALYSARPHRHLGGFSAGGHLASTAATHFDAGNPNATDPIDRAGSRPDFAILAYPVISLGEFAHVGSRNNLLGKNPDPKLVEDLSNDLRVTAQTPQTFLFHTTADTTVPVENSIRFYLALRGHGVPARRCIFFKMGRMAWGWHPRMQRFRPGAGCWRIGCGSAGFAALGGSVVLASCRAPIWLQACLPGDLLTNSQKPPEMRLQQNWPPYKTTAG